MNPYILGVADTIESDIPNYNNLTNEEKYYSLLSHSIHGLFTFLGTTQEKVSPLITDYVSIEAASLGREGYGQTVRDANELGFTGIQCHVADLGGASVGGALGEAHRISVSNPYAVVLVAGADVPKSAFKQISDLKRLTKTVAHPVYEINYGATLIGMYALLANIQMQENNITLEDYIDITKKFRDNALDNPRAFNYSKEILDKQISKPLAYPYSTPMIAIVTDHGFATLIVGYKAFEKFSQESGIRQNLSKLFIFGSGHSVHAEYFTLKGKLESPSASAAERAFVLSNLARKDVEYAWIYDCFIGMIIAQSSEYFGENPKKVAEALKKGKIPIGNREIPINLGGGILNYQAAMASSGATGLVDVMSQYDLSKNRITKTMDIQPKVSLLGGNGGIDSINSVILFGTDPNHKSNVQETKIHRRLSLNPIQNYYNSDSKQEFKATLLSHSLIHFNPGGDKKSPYVLALALLENGDFMMVNLYDKNNNEIKSIDGLKNKKTALLLKKEGSTWKGIIANKIDN